MKTERCELCRLLTRLALAFAVPWLLLVLLPYFRLSGIEPSREAALAGQDYGPARAISASAGEKVYAREGWRATPQMAGPPFWIRCPQ
ncbi:MAG: hypothetical protein R3F31_06160 [Verrucomicrobiales bacterium]